MISLRSENKCLKSFINQIKNQDINLKSNNQNLGEQFETDQEEIFMNKKFDTLLKSINSVNNNIMNYCYSYSK
jgi:hypothetical protein